MTEPLSERALQRLLAIAAGDPPPLAAPPFLPARYRIERELGRGGMGVVYEAFDTQLGRRCAVKVLGAAAGADARRRFAREALAAARLRHPHVAAVYDATPDYIAMQLVAGRPIDAIDRAERRLLIELARDAARALAHAHESGVVHRDVKPSNLLVEGRHVFVVDFGLAKEFDAAASRSAAGVAVGTPAFMPPEQARGEHDAVDARSDVYGLGATLYHCLTGSPPFCAPDLPDLLRRVVEDEPPPPRVERDLDLVLLKCLAKEREQRYPSAAALADDLDRWLRREPVVARRPSRRYRARKLLQRHRALVRAAGVAALATALVLVPIALRAHAARAAASAAVALAEHAAAVQQDAAVFTRLGDLPSAQRVLDGGIARARAFLARHEVAGVRYLLSRLLRARGQHDLALVELEQAIASDPTLDEARFERGLVRAAAPELSEDERAAAIADLSLPLRERSVLTGVDLLLGRAELHRLRGRPEQAIAALEEVLAYDPAHVAARTSLSRAALALGDAGLALHYAASAVDLQQGYGPVYLARERRTLPITILGLEGALVDFAEDLAGEPDDALARAHRGLVHLRRSVRLRAEDNVAGDSVTGERIAGGGAAEALAAVQSAVEDHDATLLMHPGLAGALNNRAVCLMHAQRLHAAAGDSAAAAAARQRAEADLEDALAVDPELAAARFNSGVLAVRTADLLRRLGRPRASIERARAAAEALRRVLASAPASWPHLPACRARLAEAESLQGQGG